MTPIDPDINGLEFRIYAKDQPEYLPLPARVDGSGTVVTCWRLTFKERCRILFLGTFFLTLLTFNHPLQPIRLSLDKPETEVLS
jgi:hypothetical protein